MAVASTVLYMIFHVMCHELRLIFREPRFWIPFLFPPVILVASQGIAVSRYGVQIMEGMEGYMMLLLGCLMAPMGAPLASDSFAGERERNSLELLQLSPVKPSEIFCGKFLAVLPFSLAFALAVQAFYWVGHPDVGSTVGLCAMLCAVASCFLINSFSLVLSLRAKTVRAATQGTLFLVIPLLLMVQFTYEILLKCVGVAAGVLLGSFLVGVVTVAVSLRKFTSL